MKIAVFATTPYATPEGRPSRWPTPPARFDPERGQQTLRNALDVAERADALGFDWISCAEHHYSPFALSPTPMLLASAISERVHRARIAFTEALELIRAAWTEPQPFGWQGRYYQFGTVAIWPRSVQQPPPPIFMSGSSPESGEIAARHRVSIGMAASSVPMAAAAARRYREYAAEHGWQPSPDNILFRTHGVVAETDAEALEVAEYFLDAPVRPDPVTSRALYVQLCRMREAIGAGILELGFQTNRLPSELALRSLELFGTRVLPRLHALWPGAAVG